MSNLLRLSVPLMLATSFGLAASVLHAEEKVRGQDTYEKKVLPIFQTYCYDCHGDGMDKGSFAMDKHANLSESVKDKKFWDNVKEHLTTHVMPPENKDQPTNDERKIMVDWIENDVFWVDPNKPDPGHVTLRRLNRVEYNNTIREVFKTDLRPASKFPPDDTGYGYDNIGDVLSLSPLLMEKYMRAAHTVAEKVVWVRPTPRWKEEKHGNTFAVTQGSGHSGSYWGSLFTNGELSLRTKAPENGVYRMALDVSAMQAGNEKAKFSVLVEGKEVYRGEAKATFFPSEPDRSWERIAFDVPLKKGDNTVAVHFLNDYADPEGAQDRKDRNFYLGKFVVNGPIRFRSVQQSGFLEWLLQNKKLTPPQLTLPGSDFDVKTNGGGVFIQEQAIFASTGTVERNFEISEPGEYRIRIIASADQAGKENARMAATLNGADLGAIEITNATGKEQWFTFRKPLEKGKHHITVSFLNDYYANGQDRNAAMDRVVIEGPISQGYAALGNEQARAWISRLGLKTFRRPLDKEDVDNLMAMVKMAKDDGAPATEVISLVAEAMLSSPKFLFRGGATPVGKVEHNTVLVDEFTLASRLSYFLWSSTPDDALLELASKGELRANLPAQVKRMINDWRAYAMADNFAGQWLQIRDIELVAPNPRMFPEFVGGLAYEMKRESQMYFDHIFRGNRSILEFLDSDYTFLNEKLARYYGIEGVKGQKFQQVSLAGTPRGGILTHGSILTLTSHPTRTSPVKRGQFLLENLLGTPPPPAPQNVPAFREDRGAKVQGTLRQRFEAHRSNPSCASCHAFLDPFGFAFENYDAIGRWRNDDNKQAVDATGKLLTGETFNGAAELRKLLVTLKKDDFTRNLIQNLLIYSLGRGLNYSDKPFVKEMTAKAAEAEYRFQDIIILMVDSIPFQRMRAEDGVASH